MTLSAALDESNNVGDALPSRLDAIAVLVNEIRAALGTTIDDTLDTLGDGSSTLEDILNNYVVLKSQRPSFVVPLTGGVVVSGSAAAAVLNSKTPYVAFDAAGTESWASPPFWIPDDWTTMDIDLYWFDDGAGSGDVVWKVQGLSLAAADNASSETLLEAGGNTTATAGAQNVIVVTDVGDITVPDNNLCQLIVSRIGGDGADTLANDAGACYLVCTKAT